MPDAPEYWPVNHFAQSNPVGEDRGDLPALLRRVADTLERIGDVDVLDLVLSTELDEGGQDVHSVAVYFAGPTRA